MNVLKRLWNEKPLTVIMALAILFRLLAVIFSKGFGMHDDHFIVIESAQSWVDGTDYNNWLPGSNGNTQPTGHNLFYPGFHYVLFLLLKFFGMVDPQAKMYIVRAIHAILSLITVYLGYKITLKLHNTKSARTVGLLLAILWFMPFLSVHNLVEVACIPFLMIGVGMILKNQKSWFAQYLIAGLVIGIAISIRPQTVLFIGGLGLALLILKKWKEALSFGLGALLSLLIIQGSIDYYVWGYPLAELREYLRVCFTTAGDYLVQPWYNYILVLAGILIPPISLFIMFGFLRTWKKYLLLFLPTLIFIVFHSYFSNKQERFIIPILPFYIMLGIIGWNSFIEKSSFWIKHTTLLKSCWIFFWIINLAILPVLSTTYSKRSRVEAMTYLSTYKNIHYLLAEDSNHGSVKMLPRYYLRQWCEIYEVPNGRPLDTVNFHFSTSSEPSFLLFYDSKNLDQRVEQAKKLLPNIQYEKTIDASLLDKVLFWMNPLNLNQSIYIYRNNNCVNKK